MVVQSKSKGVFSMRSLLCLTLVTLTQFSQAQYFADVKYKKAKQHGYDDEDDDDVSNVDKLSGSSTWMDFMHAHQKDFFQQAGGFTRLKDQWDQVYGLMTKDPESLRQNNRNHSKKGAMRSSMGTPEEAYQREKKFEEKTRLESILENKETVSDIPTSNKLFELWLEQQGDRSGLRQDDKYDLVPHETLYLHAEDIVEEENDDDMQIKSDRPVRNLKSTINGDEAVINRLEEPYPTECYNHGKLSKQTQKYYMCKSLRAASESRQSSSDQQPFRVTDETYNMLLSNYSDQYSCYTQNVENNVCVCPEGVVDFVCNTELYTRCYINITDPPFYKGCEDEFEDSFYYLYSVPGFSPCFWKNFSSSIEVEFTLNCQQIDTTGLVNMADDAAVGYPYRDVISEPIVNMQTQVSASSQIEYNEENVSAKVSFDFRDMKYLSNKKTFSTDMVINQSGQTTGSVIVDFSELQQDDSTGASKFIVGGRTYFEASVFGTDVNSFTFRGFFDEEGYEEPKSTLNKLKSSGWLWVIIGSSIALVVLLIVLYCYCSKKKEAEKQAKKHKHD